MCKMYSKKVNVVGGDIEPTILPVDLGIDSI